MQPGSVARLEGKEMESIHSQLTLVCGCRELRIALAHSARGEKSRHVRIKAAPCEGSHGARFDTSVVY